MCRLHTCAAPPLSRSIRAHFLCSEGIQYGCGHYIVTGHLSKDDCNDQFCMNSNMHPEGRCNGCGDTCKRVCLALSSSPRFPDIAQYYDPDASQSIIDKTTAYCNLCDYWFKGPGAKRDANPGDQALLTKLGNPDPQRRRPRHK